MVGEFTSFIKNQLLFTENDPVLLAVSGGIDSTVMTHLFAQSSYRFAIAHVNFGLRGTESDEDERWIAVLADRYGVPYHTQQFSTTQYASAQGISTEMAARQLRYRWFEDVRTEHHYARIATAHHQDDQLETMLFNLCQGTGIAGLRGMLARRGHLVRPMLFTHRARIEAYARDHRLAWREDRSNASDTYRRNRIRHHVIPQLKRINPNVIVTNQFTQERLLATEQLLMTEVKRVEQQCRQQSEGETLLDKRILKEHPQRTLVLAEVLRPFGFSYSRAREVSACIGSEAIAGKVFTASDYTLVVDRRFLIISENRQADPPSSLIQAESTELTLPMVELKFARYQAKEYSLRSQRAIAAVDEEQLLFPLTVRPWQTGDWFCPLGMEHRKKLSDFLIDQKTPLHRKSSVYVVTSGEAIVWVVGQRIDHRFRITDQTRKVYEISVTNI